MRRARLLACGLLALAAAPSLAIEGGQRDTFDDGTTQGWTSGAANPNPPVFVADAGPDGAGDGILQVTGNGGGGSGANLIAFNSAQWTGSYLAAGVTGIRATLRNLGASELAIRLLFEAPGGGFHTRSVARLPVGGGWQRVTWTLEPDDADAGVEVEATLAGVTRLRLLHAPTGAGAEPVAGVLGVDDITALTGDVCLDDALAGAALALCRVHCDVLDCPGGGGPARACARSALLFEQRTGRPPPCQDDADGDGVSDEIDNCPQASNADQADADADGVGDACDSCPEQANPGQEDSFGTAGVGDACDCPCFTQDDALAIATDPLCTPVCIASRPTSLDLLALQCAFDRPDDSVLVAFFTDFEGPLCQWNVPAPGESVVVTNLPEGQETACRAFIRDAAAEAGLECR